MATRNELQRSIWDAIGHGLLQHAAASSRQLLAIDPGNALACASLLSDRSPRTPEEVLSIGRRGLRNVANLQPWEGMPEEQFTQMTKRVRVILNAAVGQAYLDLHDEITARKYLKEVVALNPNSARDTYAAGQAFLNGKNPDPTIGYWLLARTAVLAQNTPEGKQIGQYSYERYLAAGGTEQNWEKYLQRATSAAPPVGFDLSTPNDATTTVAAGQPSSSANAGSSVAVAAPTNPVASAAPQSAAPTPPLPAPRPSSQAAVDPASRVTTAAATPNPPANGPLAGAAPRDAQDSQLPQSEQAHREPPREVATNVSPAEPPREAANDIPAVPPPPPLQLPKHRIGEPLSLGVLIQARVASRENRVAVVYALSDMLRRLRDDDEAFIVSYGKDIGFEQDLTWNYDLLEHAMESIDPEPGADLVNAVAFSAGHLARVAKNRNRALIVISDGADDLTPTTAGIFPAELTNGAARVYCIGIGVGAATERSRLQSLADRTGGGVTFIRDSGQFRRAIHQVASSLGIDFQE